jgi:hypothetical protein
MSRYAAGTWPVDYSITDKGIFAAQTAGSPEQASDFQASMEVMAVNVLWNFTNRIYSTYPTVLRPQLDRTYLPRSTFQGMGPVVQSQLWCVRQLMSVWSWAPLVSRAPRRSERGHGGSDQWGGSSFFRLLARWQ